jgi:hypothetical protein
LAILSYLPTSPMSVSKPPSVPTSQLAIPGVAKDCAQKASAAASIDLSNDDDDDDDVPLRDSRQRDKASSSIGNSFYRARAPSPRAPSPPASSVKHRDRGDVLVSIAGPDIGGSGSQSKLYVATTSVVLILTQAI